MRDEKIVIPYQIKGIKPSEHKQGYVEVLLEPVDKIEYQQQKTSHPPPIQITGVGPNGNIFPPELQQQLSQMLQQAVPPMFKEQKNYDPRRLIHVESEIDFLSRNWKYGDIINVTLEKVRKAEDVEQDVE
jgi:hypothetical protein